MNVINPVMIEMNTLYLRKTKINKKISVIEITPKIQTTRHINPPKCDTCLKYKETYTSNRYDTN